MTARQKQTAAKVLAREEAITSVADSCLQMMEQTAGHLDILQGAETLDHEGARFVLRSTRDHLRTLAAEYRARLEAL